MLFRSPRHFLKMWYLRTTRSTTAEVWSKLFKTLQPPDVERNVRNGQVISHLLTCHSWSSVLSRAADYRVIFLTPRQHRTAKLSTRIFVKVNPFLHATMRPCSRSTKTIASLTHLAEKLASCCQLRHAWGNVRKLRGSPLSMHKHRRSVLLASEGRTSLQFFVRINISRHLVFSKLVNPFPCKGLIIANYNHSE